ncbi:uncharacterized protein LOC113463968 isoform X3 [Ceratina calcarata]|uniref:Uncharacterized protein LOC113463968 isoform X3 n=1 Tax=Ceratina calcarata TaxID=156304 RepID=A0AAJ7W991_9HYME|nr:uncharacterized protein LOC113463968 isoform X3 [Ceratina calcarata]
MPTWPSGDRQGRGPGRRNEGQALPDEHRNQLGLALQATLNLLGFGEKGFGDRDRPFHNKTDVYGALSP